VAIRYRSQPASGTVPVTVPQSLHFLSLGRTEAPKLAQWAEENLPDGFAVFNWPIAQRVRLRTTNGLERINREIKRRTRVASIPMKSPGNFYRKNVALPFNFTASHDIGFRECQNAPKQKHQHQARTLIGELTQFSGVCGMSQGVGGLNQAIEYGFGQVFGEIGW